MGAGGGKQIHAVQEFKGERMSLVAYSRAGAASIPAPVHEQLVAAGFLPHHPQQKMVHSCEQLPVDQVSAPAPTFVQQGARGGGTRAIADAGME